MSNRTAFHWTPNSKPVMNGNSLTKRAARVPKEPETIEELTTPIKSPTDEKIYKAIRLRNGLTALLISDPTKSGHEEMAACALSVNVGSFSDPPSIPGLAHFVEHMVLMGSEMYPAENQFDQYVKGLGGSNNAITTNEMTTFYFEIQEKNLVGAMDMLSQFFISPLMRKEDMERARDAADSEFVKKMLIEDMRVEQMQTCMFPKGHPFSNFQTGNYGSLRFKEQSDELLHYEGTQFRDQHYSANRMTVAVQSSMDIPSLEAMVVDIFSPIRTNAVHSDDFSRFAYSADTVTPEFRSLYYVRPITAACEIRITWCLRSLLLYESKPLHYIGLLLQYKGKGSLLSYLKKKTWALNIEAGNSDDDLGYSSINTFFFTRMQLTMDGLKHLDEVIEAVFSYLDMLRRVGPNERIFTEMKTSADKRFYFGSTPRPYEFVQNLVLNMHFYLPEHYITGDQLYIKYNPTVIKEVLDSLRTNNVNIKVLSNRHTKPIQYDAREKWYGVKYRREAIPQEWLRRWMNVTAYPEFQIPEKNDYITNDFNISPLATPYVETAERLGLDLEHSSLHNIWTRTANQPPQAKTLREDNLNATINNFRLYQPNLLRKNSHMEVWYKPDLRRRSPIAMLYFFFIFPVALHFRAEEAYLLDLWGDVIQQGLQDEINRASLADLSLSISIEKDGLMVRIGGYSQHLHLLVDLTTSGMRNATETITPQMFEAVREVRGRTYHNYLIQATNVSDDLLMSILQKKFISSRKKAKSLSTLSLTVTDLQNVGRRLLKKMYMQVLIQGNIPWYQAINIAEKVHRDLNWEGVPEEEQPEFEIHPIASISRHMSMSALTSFSSNSILTMYYQGDRFTAKDNAALHQIAKMMEAQLFHTIRTKERLGYNVYNQERNTFGILGFSISIFTLHPYCKSYLEHKTETFLLNYLREVPTMNRSTCNPDNDLIELVQVEGTLQEEVDRNWKEIINKQYNFGRLFQFWAANKALTMRNVINWKEKYLNAKGHLTVQVLGGQNDQEEPMENQEPLQMTNYQLKFNVDPREDPFELIRKIDKLTKYLHPIEVPKVQPA